jgi:hypothetical protein
MSKGQQLITISQRTRADQPDVHSNMVTSKEQVQGPMIHINWGWKNGEYFPEKDMEHDTELITSKDFHVLFLGAPMQKHYFGASHKKCFCRSRITIQQSSHYTY